MSIGDAVRELIVARGLLPAEVGDRLVGTRHRATLYRVLRGQKPNLRMSTLAEMCKVLAISPDELLQLSGLLAPPERPPALIDVELRQAFSELKHLDEDDKRACLAVLRSLIDLRARPDGGRSRRRVRRRSRTPTAP